ncbi:dipeptidase [Sphingosinicella sp. CPCC 101087]|uniref:dipeptidase n=1 Tax=Sphingosinicella sp. CPCC 101087 TaxID=2497754 RepID=UPI00101D326C|nr:dipeptidase [Sphingosinicella sp. CPCC 101087]
MRLLAFLALPLVLAVPAAAQTDADVTAGDRLAHEQMLVLDTHLDIPARWDDGEWDFGALHRYEWDLSQVDLPRMEQGGLDGGFMVIYTPQGDLTPEGYREARDAALARAVAIHRVIAENDDRMGLALTADDAERLHREGRRIAFISMENGWPLGEDLSLLSTFRRLGLRMAGPVHSRTNQLADSTTGEARWNGLSPLGEQWVAEMNRLGLVIDGSHSSDAALDDMLELSRVPIVLSHSGPKAIFDHPRNLDDGRMRRLAEAGGVMFINSIFLSPYDTSPERDAINDRHGNWAELDADERRRLLRDRAALDAQRPYTSADFDLFMRSLLHAVAVMGVDHVGLGADWDGGGGVIGMEDVSRLPRITARLRREGLSDADIAKIMGGNLLRVLRQVQGAAERPAS